MHVIKIIYRLHKHKLIKHGYLCYAAKEQILLQYGYDYCYQNSWNSLFVGKYLFKKCLCKIIVHSFLV